MSAEPDRPISTAELLRAASVPDRYQGCQALDIRCHAGILVIGLNRPSKRNAIGVEMTLEIERTLETAATDDAVKAIVIHGVGGNFSAGMDMKDFFDHSDRDAALLRRARAATDHWRARLLRQLPQPIVSAVEGYCLGGALPILECSDVVLASAGAKFGLPEINFGFVPGGPIAKSALNAMGVRGSRYAALTGRPFNARQARKWGLVTEIVEADDLCGQAIQLAAAIKAAAEASPLPFSFQTEHLS
jgi:enoyl-CoA hydratase/carnithine racemase